MVEVLCIGVGKVDCTEMVDIMVLDEASVV